MQARAQRADENAIVAASDAFGTSVGQQTIGLYSPTNARGFNPMQAGNLRIEGFYFDQQTPTYNAALFSGSEMRIGVAAQSYPFPSPTGIADYKLRTPGDHATLSAVLTRGPFDESTTQLDGQYPIIKGTLSAGLSVLDYHNFDYQAAQRVESTRMPFCYGIGPASSSRSCRSLVTLVAANTGRSRCLR